MVISLKTLKLEDERRVVFTLLEKWLEKSTISEERALRHTTTGRVKLFNHHKNTLINPLLLFWLEEHSQPVSYLKTKHYTVKVLGNSRM